MHLALRRTFRGIHAALGAIAIVLLVLRDDHAAAICLIAIGGAMLATLAVEVAGRDLRQTPSQSAMLAAAAVLMSFPGAPMLGYRP
jgi:hypothetical protein